MREPWASRARERRQKAERKVSLVTRERRHEHLPRARWLDSPRRPRLTRRPSNFLARLSLLQKGLPHNPLPIADPLPRHTHAPSPLRTPGRRSLVKEKEADNDVSATGGTPLTPALLTWVQPRHPASEPSLLSARGPSETLPVTGMSPRGPSPTSIFQLRRARWSPLPPTPGTCTGYIPPTKTVRLLTDSPREQP